MTTPKRKNLNKKRRVQGETRFKLELIQRAIGGTIETTPTGWSLLVVNVNGLELHAEGCLWGHRATIRIFYPASRDNRHDEYQVKSQNSKTIIAAIEVIKACANMEGVRDGLESVSV